MMRHNINNVIFILLILTSGLAANANVRNVSYKYWDANKTAKIVQTIYDVCGKQEFQDGQSISNCRMQLYKYSKNNVADNCSQKNYSEYLKCEKQYSTDDEFQLLDAKELTILSEIKMTKQKIKSYCGNSNLKIKQNRIDCLKTLNMAIKNDLSKKCTTNNPSCPPYIFLRDYYNTFLIFDRKISPIKK